MTMLYVYGVVDSSSLGGSPLTGHDAASVFAVACGDCAAAASNLSRRTIVPGPGSVWLHEQVLEALMRRHAVLPLRFGTLVPDAEMLRNRLAAMLPTLSDDLRRLRGRVEFALRVTGVDTECLRAGDAAEPSDARTPSPGTRYLRERAERRRHRIAFEDAARCTERALRQHLDPTAEAPWGRLRNDRRLGRIVPGAAQGRLGVCRGSRRRSRASPGAQDQLHRSMAPYSFVTVRPPEA